MALQNLRCRRRRAEIRIAYRFHCVQARRRGEARGGLRNGLPAARPAPVRVDDEKHARAAARNRVRELADHMRAEVAAADVHHHAASGVGERLPHCGRHDRTAQKLLLKAEPDARCGKLRGGLAGAQQRLGLVHIKKQDPLPLRRERPGERERDLRFSAAALAEEDEVFGACKNALQSLCHKPPHSRVMRSATRRPISSVFTSVWPGSPR